MAAWQPGDESAVSLLRRRMANKAKTRTGPDSSSWASLADGFVDYTHEECPGLDLLPNVAPGQFDTSSLPLVGSPPASVHSVRDGSPTSSALSRFLMTPLTQSAANSRSTTIKDFELSDVNSHSSATSSDPSKKSDLRSSDNSTERKSSKARSSSKRRRSKEKRTQTSKSGQAFARMAGNAAPALRKIRKASDAKGSSSSCEAATGDFTKPMDAVDEERPSDISGRITTITARESGVQSERQTLTFHSEVSESMVLGAAATPAAPVSPQAPASPPSPTCRPFQGSHRRLVKPDQEQASSTELLVLGPDAEDSATTE